MLTSEKRVQYISRGGANGFGESKKTNFLKKFGTVCSLEKYSVNHEKSPVSLLYFPVVAPYHKDDMNHCVENCNWFLEKLEKDTKVLYTVIFSMKLTFMLIVK